MVLLIGGDGGIGLVNWGEGLCWVAVNMCSE